MEMSRLKGCGPLSRLFAGNRFVKLYGDMVTDSSTTIPPPAHMHWPALEAVREHGDSITIEEHDDAVAEKLGFTDEQLSEVHGDGSDTEFRYRMRWTRNGLQDAGALENSSRGVWVLTNVGRKIDEHELAERAKKAKRSTNEPGTALSEGWMGRMISRPTKP